MSAQKRVLGTSLAVVVGIATLGTLLRWRPADSLPLLSEIGVTAVITVITLLAGYAVLELLQVTSRLPGLERLVLALATGQGILVAGVLLLGLTGLLSRGSVLGWEAVVVVLGIVPWRRTWQHLREAVAELRDEASSRPAVAGWLLLAAALLMPFVAALLPEVLYDSLLYHLEAPEQWLQAGRLAAVAGSFHLNYPVNASVLFLTARVIDPSISVSLVHWSFLPACALALIAIGKSLGRGIGLIAALLFAVTPSVLEVAGFAVADLVVVFWILAALLVWLRWREEPDTRLLVLCGAALGLAVGAKYTAILVGVLPVTVLTLVSPAAAGRSRRLAALAIIGIVCLMVLSPWLIRNGIETGNPLFPYFFAAREPFASSHSFQQEIANRMPSDDAGVTRLVVHAVRGPIELLTTGVGMAPLVGMGLLIPLPFLLLRRPLQRRVRLLLLAGGIGFLGWDLTVHVTRYALPFLACLAVPAAVALAREPVRWRRRFLVACVGVSLAHNLLLGWLAFDWGAVRDLARGAISREDYLTRSVSYYGAVRHANQHLGPHDRVLFVGEARGYYCRIPHVVSGPERTPLLFEIARRHGSEPLAQALREQGFTHILYSRSELQRFVDQGRVLRPPPEVGLAVAQLLEHNVELLFDDGNVLLARIRYPSTDAPRPR